MGRKADFLRKYQREQNLLSLARAFNIFIPQHISLRRIERRDYIEFTAEDFADDPLGIIDEFHSRIRRKLDEERRIAEEILSRKPVNLRQALKDLEHAEKLAREGATAPAKRAG